MSAVPLMAAGSSLLLLGEPRVPLLASSATLRMVTGAPARDCASVPAASAGAPAAPTTHKLKA